jgi:hypothetical protein
MAQLTTINAPDWEPPPGPDVCNEAAIRFGRPAKNLKELWELLEEADGIFRDELAEKKEFLKKKDTVIIKTKKLRFTPYYLEKGVPFPQQTYELKQSSCTYRLEMRILYSAIELKWLLEFVAGREEAAALYEELETCFRFITVKPHKPPASGDVYLSASGDSYLPATAVMGRRLLYAGNNISPGGDKRAVERIITKLKELEVRRLQLNSTKPVPQEQWSDWATIRKFMTALGFGESYKTFKTWTSGGIQIEKRGRQLIRIQLDGLDKTTRDKLSKVRSA